MKRIITSILAISFMSINSLNQLFLNPINQASINLEPQNQIYKLNESKSLSMLTSIQAIHQDNLMATAYIDTAGITRATTNIYNNDFELINQLQVDELSIPKLNTGNNGVTNYSNSIIVNNQIITYFQTDETDDSSSRHKLLVYKLNDVNNQLPYLINLVATGNVIIHDNIQLEIEYVNNHLYLTTINIDNFTYSIADITFDLTQTSGGYYVGALNYLASSTSSIISVQSSSNLDFCQTFDTNAYCYDRTTPNQLFTLDLTGIDITQTIFTYNNYYVGVKTVNGESTVKLFKYQKNSSANALELILIKAFPIDSTNVSLAQLNFVYNRLEVYYDNYKYMVNLTSGELLSGYFYDDIAKDVLYNQVGKKLEIEVTDTFIYASSDFDNLTYVILNYGFQILALNYYQDKLLFIAYDSVQQIYYYYSYTISPLTSGGAPTRVLELTKEDIRILLNNAIGANTYPNTTNINLVAFEFHFDQLFIVDEGRLATNGNINIINYKFDNTKIVYYYSAISLTNIFRPSYRISTTNSSILYLEADAIDDNDVFGKISLEVDPSKNNQLNSSTFYANDTVNDYLGSYYYQGFRYDYLLNVLTFRINVIKVDGATTISNLSVDIPKTALKGLVNPYFGELYIDFSSFFPYYFMHFSFDNYNNLYIRDYLNNIHIMYNPFLATQNNPGLISINNEYLDINANSFDLAVSANINSIIINIRSFFNRVLVTNPTPFSLNDGQNVINITLKSLDNTIKTITFNILKAPAVPSSPPIVLPGLDPNYVPPSSSAQSSSVASSSVISSSISSSYLTSSSSSSNNVTTSSSSSIGGDNPTNNEEENPLFIWIILGIPAIITLTILGYAQILKGRAKSKVKVKGKKRRS